MSATWPEYGIYVTCLGPLILRLWSVEIVTGLVGSDCWIRYLIIAFPSSFGCITLSVLILIHLYRQS